MKPSTFGHQPIPNNLRVADSVFYLDGKYIDEDHADSIADKCGFIEEDGKTGLRHLEEHLQKRQDAARQARPACNLKTPAAKISSCNG